MNMAEAKQALMYLANGEYHSLRYEVIDDGNGGVSQTCGVYINGFGRTEAHRWELALSELKDETEGKPLSEDLPVSAKS